MLLRQYAAEDVLWAVTEALQRGAWYADAVRSLLVMRSMPQETPRSLDPNEFMNMPVMQIPPAGTEHFNRLLRKGGAVH